MAVEVIIPGMLTTVQDLGRYGKECKIGRAHV